MSEPLVSMVMPVWRPRREWLLEAVRSCLEQEGPPVEVVLVDDGNDQPVAELLTEVSDDRLRVVRIEHGGVAVARNAALAAARGALIRQVDADDVCPPSSNAHLLELMGGRDDVIAYGAVVQCDEELRPRWTMTTDQQGFVLEECLLGRFTTRLPGMLVPRRVVEAAGAWDPSFRVSGDWDWTMRALEHATVAGDHVPVLLYRRSGGTVTADVEAGEQGARRVVERYFERHPEQRGTPLERRARARVEAQAARVHLTKRRLRPAVRRAGGALSEDPRALIDEARLGWLRLRAHLRPR